MTILIANDGFHAHYFERMGWYNALNEAGIQVGFYDCKNADAFDVFDQVEPSIFIGQLYNLDRATIKCIKERPHLKVGLRAGHYSKNEKLMNNPHMLTTNNEELQNLEEIRDSVNFIYCHYLQEDMEETHELFRAMGFNVLGVPMAADLINYYNGEFDERLKCDIGFVGGYWPYKGQIIDKYLTPLLSDYKYSAKIFGNQPWPHVNQYCGMLDEQHVKNLFASAQVCPNLSEPHAHEFGFDVNERAFKVLAAGGLCVMDNVRAAKKIFGDHVIFADTPEQFRSTIDALIFENKSYKIAKHIKNAQDFIVNNHTSFHRVISMLNTMEETSLAEKVQNALNNYILKK
jgi:spore maturation protein CgeB